VDDWFRCIAAGHLVELIFSFRLIAAGQGAARYTRPRPNADGQVEELKASKRSFKFCVRQGFAEAQDAAELVWHPCGQWLDQSDA
jgi:hypothetical protein